MRESNLNLSKIIFLFISFSTLYILIYNILHFNPILGYDSEAHFNETLVVADNAAVDDRASF